MMNIIVFTKKKNILDEPYFLKILQESFKFLNAIEKIWYNGYLIYIYITVINIERV